MAGLADALQILGVDEQVPVSLMRRAVVNDGSSHHPALGLVSLA